MKLIFRFWLGAVLGCVNITIVQASEIQRRASLVEVYNQAFANDAKLAAARSEYLASREALPQARAGLLPTLTAGASFTTQTLIQANQQTTRDRSHTVFHANLTQPLIRLDRWYQLKAVNANLARAELELASKEQDLILEVAQVYFETLKATDLLAASQSEEDALRRLLLQAQARQTKGAAAITDVLEAQAAFDNTRANRQLAQRRVDDAFERLSRLTASSYATLEGLHHYFPISPPSPANSVSWVEQAVGHNLSLLASEFQVSATAEATRQHKAALAPTLDVVASYRQGDNDSFGYTNTSSPSQPVYQGSFSQRSVALELTVPLYAGGSGLSRIREAGYRYAQSQDQHEDLRREIVQRTRDLHRAIHSDIEQVSARQQSLKSSHASLLANTAGRELGTRNTADVLEAQRKLYTAVKAYNEARYDFVLNTLRLRQVAGTLASADLVALSSYGNKTYDPAVDFLPPAFRSEL